MSPTNKRMFVVGTLLPFKDYYLLLYQIFLLALLLNSSQTGHCQRSSTEYDASLASPTTTPTTTTTTTTISSTSTPSPTTASASSSDNGGSELILSAEEFVDSREVPMILIDGSTNEDSANNATSLVSENVAVNGTSRSSNSTTKLDSSRQPAINSDNVDNNQGTTTTTSSASSTVTTAKPDSESNEHEVTDELDDDADDDLDSSRLQPNDSGRNSFEPPQNISQYMDYIEKLFHDLRHQITHLFEPHLPQLIRTSQMVELTSPCSYDMLRMALALRQFEPWALRMIDSSGKVPEGIFEGSFTALGSYDECLNTVFQSASSHSSSQVERDSSSPSSGSESTYTGAASSFDQTAPITNGKQVVAPGSTQGKYCLVTVSPFMPPKPPADKVERLFQEEANRRNYTRDDQFSRLSPMFYYMKFRIGVCMPSTCDRSDMDSISGALSSSLRLNITIPDCRVKQTDEQLTRHQLVGGLTFALVTALVLLATLIDCFKLKWKQLEIKDIEFIQGAKSANNANNDGHHHDHQLTLGDSAALARSRAYSDLTKVTLDRDGGLNKEAVKIKIGNQHQQSKSELNSGYNDCGDVGCDQQRDRAPDETTDNTCSNARLVNRLGKHWTWLSFSLITNFRLHFQSHRSRTISTKPGDDSSMSGPCKAEQNSSSQVAKPQTEQRMIACLNGIRVLSLCWIIVANSYLTLDPRATKRLTKTREAPRDFLFQLVVQASLAIETFFFLSGLLMSLSFSRSLRPSSSETNFDIKTGQRSGGTQHVPMEQSNTTKYLLKWVQFYVHRYVRMTPPTMLVIAFSMYAYHYSDGPLWFEATQKVHQSCAQNWWRHLLHVANFIDTRQMCFIHYWYIAADMQLFLFAPLIMFLLFKYRQLGYFLIALVGATSTGLVFYTTYSRNLPPTLLFYSTDPESRREFGNTVMTKPMTHVLPYLVGMLVGWWCIISNQNSKSSDKSNDTIEPKQDQSSKRDSLAVTNKIKTLDGARVFYPDNVQAKSTRLQSSGGPFYSAKTIFGSLALAVALVELFLPYKWNNSHLPSRLMASIYAALFRLGWSLVLAYVVISCRHHPGKGCNVAQSNDSGQYCFCGSGGNYINRLLGLNIFTHLSKLSFVAYLIHLPLMSVFIGQTRGLFAFSHTLVLHFAISYLVISFTLSFLLVHFIEFPFVTFERLLFDRLFRYINKSARKQQQQQPMQNTATKSIKAHEQYVFYQDPLIRSMIRMEEQQPHDFGSHESSGRGFNLPANQLHRTTTGASQHHQHDPHHNHNHITTERL